MGRSAKVHKRVKKTVSSASQSHSSKLAATQQSIPPPPSRTSASSASNPSKRRSTLKQKAAAAVKSPSSHQNQPSDGTKGHVLGGADYVDLMMGSRRRAREEAEKLPLS